MKLFTTFSCALLSVTPAFAQRVVNAGDNLQTALNAVQPGEVLTLQAGATFTGNFVLPVKSGSGIVTVRSSGTLPPGRVSRGDEPAMALVRSPNALQALKTAPGAAHWRFEGIVLTAASVGDVVQLGDGSSSDPSTIPTDITFEHCIVRSETDTATSKNGIVINGAAITIRNSRIEGIKLPGTESHAIVGWGGPGPFTIENNYIEGGSIGLLIGGAKPSIDGLVPSDIVIRWNTFSRPIEWRSQNYATKNQLELKNARRVTITGNLIENNWPQGQAGFIVVFTIRANSDTAPWTTIEDVLFQDNIVRHSAQAFNILGHDTPQASQTMDRVTIRNNLIYDIDRWVWGGSGQIMNIDGGPRNLHIERNTMLSNGNIINLSGAPMPGFIYRGNIVQKVTSINPTTGAVQSSYGINGTGVGEGNAAIAAFMQADRIITDNVLAGATPSMYPTGNLFPTVSSVTADMDADFRVRVGSSFETFGMDRGSIDSAMLPPSILAPEAVVIVP
jgi:hypothetical protein